MQKEITEYGKLLNEQGQPAHPGWARRPIMEYVRKRYGTEGRDKGRFHWEIFLFV